MGSYKKFYRINQNIHTPNLRVIDQEGKQIGVLTLVEAQKKAQEAGLDLVEIAPTANPPVAKIINFKKFLYQEEKKERASKKSRGGEVKGIRLKPFIAQGDFEVRVRRAAEFLKENNKVKVEVRFSGGQLRQKEFGSQIIYRFVEALSPYSKPEQEPKWLGKNLIVTLSPIKGGKENGEKEQTENQEIDLKKI